MILLWLVSMALGADADPPTDAWLLRGAEATRPDYGDRCVLTALKTPVALPEGVRVSVREVVLQGCTQPLLRASFEPATWPRVEQYSFWVRAEHVSDKAPAKNAWSKASPTGPDQYLGGVNSQRSKVVGQALDMRAQPLTFFGPGDRVQVLVDGRIAVVRLADGRTFAVPGQRLRGQADPLSADPDQRSLRERLMAGRVEAERDQVISTWPHQGFDVLKKELGKTFIVEIDPRQDSSEVFESRWFDPVGQVYRPSCDDRPDPGEPCAPIYLDYSAFGAWWPRKAVTVLARVEGTYDDGGQRIPHLKVLVKEPWATALRVSPEWDGTAVGE